MAGAVDRTGGGWGKAVVSNDFAAAGSVHGDGRREKRRADRTGAWTWSSRVHHNSSLLIGFHRCIRVCRAGVRSEK